MPLGKTRRNGFRVHVASSRPSRADDVRCGESASGQAADEPMLESSALSPHGCFGLSFIVANDRWSGRPAMATSGQIREARADVVDRVE